MRTQVTRDELERRKRNGEEVLRDGEYLTVPLMFRDSGAQFAQQIIDHQQAIDEGLLVVDGSGKTDGLHRPGHRIPVRGTPAANAADCAEAARLTRRVTVQDAWRTVPARAAVGDAEVARTAWIDEISNAWRQPTAA